MLLASSWDKLVSKDWRVGFGLLAVALFWAGESGKSSLTRGCCGHLGSSLRFGSAIGVFEAVLEAG